MTSALSCSQDLHKIMWICNIFSTYPFLDCLPSFWTLTLLTVILFLGKTAPADFWHLLWLLLTSRGSLFVSFGGILCSTAEGVRSTDLFMPGMTGSGVRLSHSSEVMVTSLTRGGGRGRAHLSQGRHLRCTWRLSTRWPRTCTLSEVSSAQCTLSVVSSSSDVKSRGLVSCQLGDLYPD